MRELESIKKKLTKIQKQENPELKQKMLLELKQELNTVLLHLFEEKVFSEHSMTDVMDDLQKMYFAYICNDDTTAFERQTATISFKLLAKTLTAINGGLDPDSVNSISINPSF